jgi:hypothetical protein
MGTYLAGLGFMQVVHPDLVIRALVVLCKSLLCFKLSPTATHNLCLAMLTFSWLIISQSAIGTHINWCITG